LLILSLFFSGFCDFDIIFFIYGDNFLGCFPLSVYLLRVVDILDGWSWVLPVFEHSKLAELIFLVFTIIVFSVDFFVVARNQ
jgi:hypothetical protein